MALYTPMPFVPERFDQTAQRLSLAQMAYEAELARIQAAQQARMQQGQMIAGLGSVLPDFVNQQMQLAMLREQQQQRRDQLATEKTYREGLIAAQAREDRIRQEELAYRREVQDAQMRQQGVEDVATVGLKAGLTPDQYEQLAGTPYAQLFAPDTTASLAALSQVPTVAGASQITPAVSGYVSRETQAQQAAAAQLQQERIAAATAMGADEATAQMFGLTGQTSVLPKPTAEAPRVMAFGDQLLDVQRMPSGEVSTRVLREKAAPPPAAVAAPPVKRIQNTTAADDSKAAVVNIAAALPEANRGLWVEGWRDLEEKALQRNDWTDAAKYVAAKAVEQMPAAMETRIAGKLEAAQAVASVMQELDTLNQRGLLGLLPNTYEKVQNFAGQTQDPALAAAAARLLTVMQEYRRATTGVAFSEAERKEFERILPGTGKSLEFNQALFAGMKQSLESALRSTLGLRIGDKYMNYLLQDVNRRIAPAPSSGATAPSGNVRPAGGNVFRKPPQR